MTPRAELRTLPLDRLEMLVLTIVCGRCDGVLSAPHAIRVVVTGGVVTWPGPTRRHAVNEAQPIRSGHLAR